MWILAKGNNNKLSHCRNRLRFIYIILDLKPKPYTHLIYAQNFKYIGTNSSENKGRRMITHQYGAIGQPNS